MSTGSGTPKPVPALVIERLKAVVGAAGYLETAADVAPYCRSWRDDWQGQVPLVLRPTSSEQVAEIVRVCAQAGVAIIPQGGNTGLTGAAQPHADLSEVIVSMARMNRIRGI